MYVISYICAMEFNGKLISFSGPSGSGKTSIVKALLQRYPDSFGFSISATTRQKRANEKDGVDYYFISKEEFQEKIKEGAFIEWEEVYDGVFYGTLRSEVERLHQIGKHVLFDIDVEGGLSIKRIYGKRALSIFVMPPSVEELEKRLRNRQTENEDALKKRVDKAIIEIQKAPLFDVIIVNDDLTRAIMQAEHVVRKFLNEK